MVRRWALSQRRAENHVSAEGGARGPGWDGRWTLALSGQRELHRGYHAEVDLQSPRERTSQKSRCPAAQACWVLRDAQRSRGQTRTGLGATSY